MASNRSSWMEKALAARDAWTEERSQFSNGEVNQLLKRAETAEAEVRRLQGLLEQVRKLLEEAKG